MSLSKEIKDLQMMQHNTVLLMIGKTGSGKSATGNIIFNDQVFESEMSYSSVTRVCQTRTRAVNNRTVTVIDTPDFILSTHTDFDSDSELKKALCKPGAHVILLILPLGTFTEQENDFIGWFEQVFGAEALRFTVVLFTHADQRHMRSLGEMIRGSTQLSDFINRCGQRYHEFNIKSPANRQQVNELMEMIDILLSENRNSCYTLEIMLENKKRRKEEKRADDERKDREHQMKLESVRRETEMCVRKEYEQKRAEMEKQDTFWKKLKYLFIKQIKLKYFCVFMFFAVVTGGVLMWKKEKDSKYGWMFIKGFFTGGLSSTAGVFTGFLWRLMWKSQFICTSSHEHPGAVRQLLLKAAGVVCGLSAGVMIDYFLGGNVFPVTSLAGLAGAAAAFTAIQ